MGKLTCQHPEAGSALKIELAALDASQKCAPLLYGEGDLRPRILGIAYVHLSRSRCQPNFKATAVGAV